MLRSAFSLSSQTDGIIAEIVIRVTGNDGRNNADSTKRRKRRESRTDLNNAPEGRGGAGKRCRDLVKGRTKGRVKGRIKGRVKG